MNTKETGKLGEEIASTYLTEKGYTILAKNWQNKHEEIDIIAEKNNVIAIVEVKSRTSPFLVNPELAVTVAKQKLLIQATNAYITQKNINKEVRFDIIAIVFYGTTHKIEHIEDAFYPKVR